VSARGIALTAEDQLRCDWCGRFDTNTEAYNCLGCGAFMPACKLIDVMTIADDKPRYLRVPA
jgi:hypothetical protein